MERLQVASDRMRLDTSSQMGEAHDTMSYAGQEVPVFHLDPVLVLRATKISDLMCATERVLITASKNLKFLHLIAHVAV